MKKFTVSSVLCIVSACMFLFSSFQTFAAWQSQGDTINSITMKSVKGQIVEVYEQNQVVYPNAVVDKIVRIKNTGNADALPRVKIEKVWGDGRDKNGNLLINPDLSTDNIEIIYNTDKWFYNENDGYFYYKGVLKSGEMTDSLFDSFKINGEKTGGDYKNKEADIIVTMEMIQADENGPSYWNTSFEELGITYTPDDQNIITEVSFNGPVKGFEFEVNGGDLFANFKNLVPGESRSQIIEFTNNWDTPVELFLWADYVSQSQATDETRDLINQLLHKHAKIVITNENGNVIYNGTVWGNLDVDSTSTDSMKYPYSLGNFEGHQTKRLNVSLTLDSQMDNEYKTLLGLIKWVISAQGADPPSGNSTVTPTTNTSTSSSDTVTTVSMSAPVGNNTQTVSRSTTVTAATTAAADIVTTVSTSAPAGHDIQTVSRSTTVTAATTAAADIVTTVSTSLPVGHDIQTVSRSTTVTAATTAAADIVTTVSTSLPVGHDIQTVSRSTTKTVTITVPATSTSSSGTAASATEDNNTQTTSLAANTNVTTSAYGATSSVTVALTSAQTSNNTQTSAHSTTNKVVITSVTKDITGSSDNNGFDNKQESPKTGDFNNVGKYGAMSVVSLILMLVTYKKSKYESES